MSFDLSVSFNSLPEALRTNWEQALSRYGFEAEILPTFDPRTWEGGFLPLRVWRAPAQLVGFELPSEAVSGCEVTFVPKAAHFRFGAGGPTTEFAMLCFAAATLAELTNGSVFDPQAGRRLAAPDAIAAATQEALAYVEAASASELVHHEFPGWQVLSAT